MDEATAFTAGSHAQTTEGPVELGVVVSRAAMGVVVEAPFLGRLRAAFDVLDDGSARLSTLTRRGADGVEVAVAGAAEVARVAKLSAALEESRGWEPRARAAEEALAQTSEGEQHLSAQLASTRGALNETETALRASRNELTATQALLREAKSGQRHDHADAAELRTALQQAEGRLKRAQVELAAVREEAAARQEASAAELAEVTSRFERELNARVAADAERDAARSELEDTRGRLEAADSARAAAENEVARLKPMQVAAQGRDEAVRKLKISEEARRTAEEQLAARTAALATVTPQRDVAQAELAVARQELEAAAQASAELTTVRMERDAAQSELTAANHALEATRAELAVAQTAQAELPGVLTELNASRARVSELTLSIHTLRAAAALAKQEKDDVAVKLGELETTANAERGRADALYGQVGQLRSENERTTAELDEERSGREELVRDLAYIQSQVSDLASTKGELVTKVGQMTQREESRRRTSAEFSDVLRTAEVVAADRLLTARRQQARAGKLEDELKALQQNVALLQRHLAAAQTEAAKVGPLVAERNALKVDIAFFQKQLGAAQRAKQPPPKPPGTK